MTSKYQILVKIRDYEILDQKCDYKEIFDPIIDLKVPNSWQIIDQIWDLIFGKSD